MKMLRDGDRILFPSAACPKNKPIRRWQTSLIRMISAAECRRWGRRGILGLVLIAAATSLDASVQRISTSARHVVSPIPATAIGQRKPDGAEKLISFEVIFEMNPGDSGVLIVAGDQLETFALYVRFGRLTVIYQNVFQEAPFSVQSDELPIGVVSARFDLGPEDGLASSHPRTGTLIVNGKRVGCTPPIEYTIATGAPNSIGGTDQTLENLTPEQTFTGTIWQIVPRFSLAP